MASCHSIALQGSYGAVRRATNRQTRQVYAVKSVPKRKVEDLNLVRREVEVMRLVRHPHIIQYVEARPVVAAVGSGPPVPLASRACPSLAGGWLLAARRQECNNWHTMGGAAAPLVGRNCRLPLSPARPLSRHTTPKRLRTLWTTPPLRCWTCPSHDPVPSAAVDSQSTMCRLPLSPAPPCLATRCG